MKPLNILFIIYDLEYAGPELRLLNFARCFSEELKMHICVTSEKTNLFDEFMRYGVKASIVPIKRPYLELAKVFSIYRFCNKNNIKIINCFDIKSLLIGTIIRFLKFNKVDLVYHQVNSNSQFSRRQNLFLKHLIKRCCKVVCNSKFSKTDLHGFIEEEKIEVIYNGTDLEKFKSSPNKDYEILRKYNFLDGEIVLGIVANFRKQKNYPFLIDAFDDLSNKFPNLRLICVGDGPDFEAIEEKVKQKNLCEQVVLVGRSENVAKLLSSMDIFILCSLYEGFPNVVLEAMCAGLPVVCSNVGGCSEMVKPMENGILFPVNDRDRFLAALEVLIQDRVLAKKLGENGRSRVREEFGLKAMVENYSNLFNQIGSKYLN